MAIGTSLADRLTGLLGRRRSASIAPWLAVAIQACRAHPDLALLLLITIVAIAPRLFLQASAPTFVFTDSPGYVEPAVDLVNGQGLTTRLKRPIGYPLLAAVGLAATGQVSTITALQHALGLLTVGLTYLLGRACANRLTGLAAALAVALSAPQLTYEHALLTEAPFTLLLVAFSLLLLRLLRRGGLPPALLAVLALASAALFRPVGQLLLPFALLAALLGPGSRRRRLLTALVAVAAFAIVVTPWMLVNLATHGRFTVGGAPGESLLARTLSYSRGRFVFDSPELPLATDPAERTARATIQTAVRSGASPGQVRDQVRAQLNLSEEETDRLLQRVTVEVIRRQPLDFLLSIPDSLVKLYLLDERGIAILWTSLSAWEKLPSLASLARRPTADQELRKGGVDALLSVERPVRFGLMLPLLGLLAPLAAWRSAQRAPIILLTGLYAFLILAQVALDGQVARYRYAAEPLLDLLTALTLWFGLDWVAQRLARARPVEARAGLAGLAQRWAPLALTVAVGVLLRTWGLNRFDPSAFGNEYDEGIRLAQLDLMNVGFKPFSQIYASQGPLLLAYFFPFYSTLGRDVLAARLGVTVASLACLAGVYLIGRLLRNPLAGLAALGLLAISPEMIQVSRLALAEVPSLGPAALALWLAILASQRQRPLLLHASAILFAFGLLLKPMVATAAVPVLLALAPGWRRPLSRQQFDWALTVVAVVCLSILAIGPGLLWEQFVAYRQGATGLGALGKQAWSLDTNFQQIRQELPNDAALVTLALASLPALVRCAPRYAAVAGSWLLTTFVMLMVYSPLAEKHVAYLLPALALLGGGGLSVGLALLRASPSARRIRLLAPIGLACAFGLLSVGGIIRADWRLTAPNSGTVAEVSDFSDVLSLTTRVTTPTDFVVTDHPYLAYVARRLLPPRLVDPSRTRILSGSLTDGEAIQQTQFREVKVVVYWASRLQMLKQFSTWLDSDYTLVRLYDHNRAVYVRNNALVGLPGYPGGPPSLDLARFGDAVSLAGFELAQDPSRDRRVSLTFQALRPVAPDAYIVHLQLRDRDGNVKLERDDRLLPPWRSAAWPAGRPLIQRRSLDLQRVDPGDYSLVLYLTEGRTGPGLTATIRGRRGIQAGSAPYLVDLGTVSVH